MPFYDETSVKSMYPQFKGNEKYKPYWSDTPKKWLPTHDYFWNAFNYFYKLKIIFKPNTNLQVLHFVNPTQTAKVLQELIIAKQHGNFEEDKNQIEITSEFKAQLDEGWFIFKGKIHKKLMINLITFNKCIRF